MTIAPTPLEKKIGELLDVFYSKRSIALNDLKLINTLKRKNPYLYRAVGVSDAGEIVEEILRAHVSSSDETLFGNEFFEPLAKWVAQKANPGHAVNTSDGEGADITITTDTSIMPIAVKSGVNVFNSDSKKKQGENFSALNKRLQKLRLHFDPVVGYCYGRKQQSARSRVNFRELAGQAFWELITTENDFYLRIVRLMGAKPIEHRLSIVPRSNRHSTKRRIGLQKNFLSIFPKRTALSIGINYYNSTAALSDLKRQANRGN